MSDYKDVMNRYDASQEQQRRKRAGNMIGGVLAGAALATVAAAGNAYVDHRSEASVAPSVDLSKHDAFGKTMEANGGKLPDGYITFRTESGDLVNALPGKYHVKADKVDDFKQNVEDQIGSPDDRAKLSIGAIVVVKEQDLDFSSKQLELDPVVNGQELDPGLFDASQLQPQDSLYYAVHPAQQ